VNISPRSKVLVVVLGAVGIFTYLVVADVGLSAGRVHYGVDVKGVEVGGLTTLEAGRELNEVGSRLARSRITFRSGEASCSFTPTKIGWNERSFDTAARAMEVGRTGGPFGALWDRARAWIAGVTVEWDDSPDPRLLAEFVDKCASAAEAAGLRLDEEGLVEAVHDAIGRVPVDPELELPVE
jgi:hypothetical protein